MRYNSGMFLIRRPTNTQIIILVFLTLIGVGAFLLALPISSRNGLWTPAADALFTSASAVCVTGLVVVDTYIHWSAFGQTVILILIQIGGLGFMSVITMFSLFLGRRIGLAERTLIMQASGIIQFGGVITLLRRIILMTMLFQSIGAIILSVRFVPLMGLSDGLFNAVFHSVSAFCNAGFDLFGKYGEFSSLSAFYQDYTVLLTISGLYIIGGLGFLVWSDIFKHRMRFVKYALHTKIVLSVSIALLALAVLGFFFLEAEHSMMDMPTSTRWVNAWFQGSTPRSSGYSPLNMNDLSQPGRLLTMFLMFIGGSPGSTAAGLKTTTFLVVVLSAMTLSRKNQHVALFRRRLTEDTIRNANAIFVIYLGIIFTATILISAVEPFPLSDILFEVVSAACTVGLSTGITPELGPFAQTVMTVLMFVGRVGLMTIVMALHGRHRENAQERVPEKILIG